MPGISAGTLGIFLNVFERFLYFASFANIKKNLLLVIIFFAGWGFGLFGASRIIVFLFYNYGQIVYFSFAGLMLGCIPLIFKKAKTDKFSPKNFVIFAMSLALMLFLAFRGGDADVYADDVIEQLDNITPAFLIMLFFTSFISSIAMLIPGVGGALMMIVFGIYSIYIEAVSSLNPVLLAVFGSSMVLGILTGIKLIKKLLESYSRSLYSSILGFILGSVYYIFPGFYRGFAAGVLSIALASAFAVLAWKLSTRGE